MNYLMTHRHKLSQGRLTAQTSLVGSVQSHGFSNKMKLGDSMEDINDLFKQMNRDFASSVSESASHIAPRVVAQKQDVVYVKNPGPGWGLNRALNFASDDLVACTLSLEESQAIALLLNNADGKTLSSEQSIDQTDAGFKVDLKWGQAQTITGKLIGKESAHGDVSSFDLL